MESKNENVDENRDRYENNSKHGGKRQLILTRTIDKDEFHKTHPSGRE